MPLGSFRQSLNLATTASAPGVSYNNWAGTTATDVGVSSAIMGMWPYNDTTMICATRNAGRLNAAVISRTGTTLSVANPSIDSSLSGFYSTSETTPSGFIVDQTNSVGYAWGANRRIAKFYNISNGGAAISGNFITPTNTALTQPFAMRVLSNGTLRLWCQHNGALYRHDYVINGTSTISFGSQTTTTITGYTGVAKAVSVINDNEVLIITLSGSTVYAYHVNGTTLTQIGSTISAGSYTTYPGNIGPYTMQDQQGNRVTWTSYASNVGWKVYTATSAGFTSYNITNVPSGGRGANVNNNTYNLTIANHVEDLNTTVFMNRYAEHQVWTTKHNTSALGAGRSIFGNSDIHCIRNWGPYLAICGNSTRFTILTY
jgi:hypothetical protein